jgi:hypothetical protein
VDPKFPKDIVCHELSLVRVGLLAAKAKLLLHHSIMLSEEDRLTKAIISWMPLGEGGFTDDCMEASSALGVLLPLAKQISIPYVHLSGILEHNARVTQHNALKKSLNSAKATTNSYVLSKLDWGAPDVYLVSDWPAHLKSAYLGFRAGCCGLRVETKGGTNLCRLCSQGMETHIHVFLHCPAVHSRRLVMIEHLRDIGVMAVLEPLSDAQSMHFLLGAGHASLSSHLWLKTIYAVAVFLSRTLHLINVIRQPDDRP